MDITVDNYKVRVSSCGVSGFWAEVSALPGCFSHGASIEELETSIKDAIRSHNSALLNRGRNIPLDTAHDAESQAALLMRRRGMDADRFVRILMRAGLTELGRTKDHIVLLNDETQKQITIPLDGIDLSPKMIRNVLNQADVSEEYYREIRLDVPVE